MIGTLLGMVQMFANMSDPSKLGPFMAVSLLATLYGALVGNLICLPIADKFHLKLEEEDISRRSSSTASCRSAIPRARRSCARCCMAYLPDHHRHEMAEAA